MKIYKPKQKVRMNKKAFKIIKKKDALFTALNCNTQL